MRSRAKLKMTLVAAAMTFVSPVDAQKRRPAAKPVSDFQRLLRAAYTDKTMSYLDKFAPPSVDESKLGKPFRVAFPVGNGETTGVGSPKGSAFFTYADGTLNIISSLEGGRSETVCAPYLKVDERRDTSESYEGSNAYGARTRVTIIRSKQDNIVILNAGANSTVETGPQSGPTPTEPSGRYQMTIFVNGPEARAIAYDVYMLIEGEFAPVFGGKLTTCWTVYSAPRFDSSNELFNQNCAVGTIVSSISFVRRSSGAVLKRWTLQRS